MSVHPRELLAAIVDKEVVVKQKELLVEAKFEAVPSVPQLFLRLQ